MKQWGIKDAEDYVSEVFANARKDSPDNRITFLDIGQAIKKVMKLRKEKEALEKKK